MALRRTTTTLPAPSDEAITPKGEVLRIAPTPEAVPVAYPRIESCRPNEMNGYLDPDQTLINFAVRERGMTFEQLIVEDPSRLLRNWLKCYQSAKSTAIGTTLLGAGALMVGVGVGAMPLMVAGMMTIAGSGLLVSRHHKGVEACEVEAGILDEIRPVLELFHALEQRGANPSDLVSLYDRLLKQCSLNPALANIGNPESLKSFFEAELAKHSILSKFLAVPTGFVAAVTTPPKAIASSALSPQPSAPAPIADYPSPTTPDLLPTGSAIETVPTAESGVDLGVDLWGEAAQQVAPAMQLPEVFTWESNPTTVPLKNRAEEVIKFLDGAGFPVGVILNTPTTLGYGGSQSGKSSILHLAAILELAQGKKVFYVNPDNDIPPIRFTKLAEGGGCRSALEFVEKLTAMIDKASKSQLAGNIAWVDEWYKISKFDRAHSTNDKANKMQAFIDQILGKGDKSGIKIRGAAQVATLDALGLTGISEAIGRDFLVLNAIKQPATSYEAEKALGVYECDRGGSSRERWVTPDVLKTVVRPDGKPDPVLSMLRWFPELKDESRVDVWLNPFSYVEPVDNFFVDSNVIAFPQRQQVASAEEELATEHQLLEKAEDDSANESDLISQEEINKAIPVLIVYLRDKKERKHIDEIYRLTSVRNALGGAKKQSTEAALNQLVSQSLAITDGNGNYWASDVISTNKN